MSGPTFFTTRMGQRFFEATMPKIADQLERMHTTLGEIAGALQTWNARATSAPAFVNAGDTAMPWEATLAQLARDRVQLDALEPQGSDTQQFHEISAAAIDVALRAAYHAGIAAGLRRLRAQDDERDPR